MNNYAELLSRVQNYHPLPWRVEHVREQEPDEPVLEVWMVQDRDGREVMGFGHDHEGNPLDWFAEFICMAVNG